MNSTQAIGITQLKERDFFKLQEAIWVTVINKIFKFPSHLDPFCQIDYLCDLSSSYSFYSIQK